MLSSANPNGDLSALAIDHNNAASLGVNALLLRLLLESSDSAYDASAHAQSIAEHLIEAWDESTGFPEYLDGRPTKSDYLRRYYTGIAALALVEHFEATQNESSLQVALGAVAWLESAYPAKDSNAFHPSPTPWLVEALSELNRLRPQQKLQERIFDLADHFVALQDTALFPGRFWLPKGPNFGSPNTVRDAQATRTLLTALELAVDLDETRRVKRYRRAVALALENLRAHQYDAVASKPFPIRLGPLAPCGFAMTVL